jgi:hypothetical protein
VRNLKPNGLWLRSKHLATAPLQPLSAFDCVEKHLGAEWLAARHLHSYRHHVGPSNIPIAVEPQHCRQWFTQIAVGSSQQGAPGGFGSIARRPGIVRWYGAFPGIFAPQPSAQRPAR